MSDKLIGSRLARKSANGAVGYRNVEEEDEDSELEDEADDASMATDSERVQHLRYHLDLSRQKLMAELDKGAARDRELVQSYERRVQGLETELQGIIQSQTGQDIVQAITEQGEQLVSAISDN